MVDVTQRLLLSDINKTRFVKAKEMFEQNEVFVIIGFEQVKETVINNRPAKITELRIRKMSDGEAYTLSLGYNARHENIRDFFAEFPDATSEALKLGKLATDKGNDAWVFVEGKLGE